MYINHCLVGQDSIDHIVSQYCFAILQGK